jgi:hypothetical protein
MSIKAQNNKSYNEKVANLIANMNMEMTKPVLGL